MEANHSLVTGAERGLNVKDPPEINKLYIPMYNLYNIFPSTDRAMCSSLDDTTTSSAKFLNIHIRDPQCEYIYINDLL